MRIISTLFIVLCAFTFKILYDANTFTTLHETSRIHNCTNVRDKGSVENIGIIKEGQESGRAFLPASDLTHYLTDFAVDYYPKIYTLDLNKYRLGPLTEIEVVGIDLKDLNVLHGVDCITSDARTYLFIVSHHPHHNLTTHGEYINIFEYKNNKLYFQESITSDRWTSINDVAAVGPRSFYVSLDHSFPRYSTLQQRVEEILKLRQGSIEFYDGNQNTRQVANNLLYPNGIALNNDKSKLFIGSPLVQEILTFSRESSSNSLASQDFISLDSFADNVYVDEDDGLWIAGFPKLLFFILSVKDIVNSPVMIMHLNSTAGELENVHVSNGADVSGMSIVVRYLILLYFLFFCLFDYEV